jgi:monofunctional chorismate mutase
MTLQQLRDRLNPMSGRIVYHLWQRSQLPLNHAVYQPGGVPWAEKYEAERDVSFLEFTLQKLEETQALLGKYTYSEEQPLYPDRLERPAVQREPGALGGIPSAFVHVREEILAYYQGVLPALCKEGSDPEAYGMTAYTDATLLLWVNERINHGKHVAYAKAKQPERKLREMAHDAAALRRALQDPPREEDVRKSARIWAGALNAADGQVKGDLKQDRVLLPLDERVVEDFFLWLIKITTDVQVRYLQADAVQRALGW